MDKKEIEFLYNKKNICNCENCPYNKGMDDWQDRFPCGQWSCWIAIHCARNDEE